MADTDRAIADFNQAIKVDPKFAKAYMKRGVAYDVKGDIDRATADYAQVIKLENCARGGGSRPEARHASELASSIQCYPLAKKSLAVIARSRPMKNARGRSPASRRSALSRPIPQH
jgi:tetratricopeptide (TPR) repeat protein